jgi:pimeloyl-ACP methyl ester carboxylesterase
MSPHMTRRNAMGTASASALSLTAAPATATLSSSGGEVRHRRINVDGLSIFYREAGPTNAPVLLLLHGFPASSHMFRHLIPALADQWRVIAPDYPGFGHSDSPTSRETHNFAAMADIMAKFTDALGLNEYAIYIQDYGAPVGLRLALLQPECISALIVQNGNAYEEGLSDLWAPLRTYWSAPTSENREALRGWLDLDGARLQYTAGLREEQIELLAPDLWVLDWALLNRPDGVDLQLDLFGDYRSNVLLYPAFHDFFRSRQLPTLIVWGRNDPFFTVAGAQAFLRDLPRAELHFFDTSHFALETHGADVTRLIRGFLRRNLGTPAGKEA